VTVIVPALCSVVRLNVSPSAPLRLYRMVDEPVAREALVAAYVSPAAARFSRDRGYLGEAPARAALRLSLKRIGAVPVDVVDLEPDGLGVDGARLPDSAPAMRQLAGPAATSRSMGLRGRGARRSLADRRRDHPELGQPVLRSRAAGPGPPCSSRVDAQGATGIVRRSAEARVSQTPEELGLEVELRRPRRRRRDPIPRGHGGRRLGRSAKGLARDAAMLLFGDVARRQRSPVKVSHTKRGHSARWGAHGAYLAREGAQRPVKASCPGTNDTRRVFGESRTYSRVLLPQARCVSRRSGPHLLRVGIRPACARYGPLTMSGSPDRSRRFEKTQRSQLSEQCEPCSQESARVGHRAPEAPVAGLLWRPIRSAGVSCTPHPERLRDRRSNEEGSPRATGWPRQ